MGAGALFVVGVFITWPVLFFLAIIAATLGASQAERTAKRAALPLADLRRLRWRLSLGAAWAVVFACRDTGFLSAFLGIHSLLTFFTLPLPLPEAVLLPAIQSLATGVPYSLQAVQQSPLTQLIFQVLLALGSLAPAALAAMTAISLRRKSEF